MSEYSMTIEITEDEKSLFTPVGTDCGSGDPISEVEENFEYISNLSGTESWTYGSASTYPYMDRFFTFEFDDGRVFDIEWTYVDETQEDPTFIPHWYFCGVRYGTKVDIICDAGEGNGYAELIEDPVPSVTGTYIYRVGDDYYNMTIK